MTGEVLDKMVQLATAAFGLVAALAWNAAIQEVFDEFFPQTGAILGKFFYAVVVTIIVVFVTIYLGRAAERAKKIEEDRKGGLFSRSEE